MWWNVRLSVIFSMNWPSYANVDVVKESLLGCTVSACTAGILMLLFLTWHEYVLLFSVSLSFGCSVLFVSRKRCTSCLILMSHSKRKRCELTPALGRFCYHAGKRRGSPILGQCRFTSGREQCTLRWKPWSVLLSGDSRNSLAIPLSMHICHPEVATRFIYHTMLTFTCFTVHLCYRSAVEA